MISAKKLFCISFGILVFLRALTWHEFAEYIPYTEVTILYLLILSLFLVKQRGISIPAKAPGCRVLLILTVYFIVWGVCVIPEGRSDATGVMFRSLLMVAVVAISCLCIRKLDCIDNVVRASYIALVLLLIVISLIYFYEFNIIATLQSFWIPQEWLRTRARLGFANNIPAEYAMSAILLSIYILKINKPSNKRIIYCVDFFMVFIILANNSRGTLFALIVSSIIYFYLKILRPRRIKRVVKIGIILIIGIVFYIVFNSVQGNIDIVKLLDGTNRSHFIKNLMALASSGRWFMGFGNISGAFFSEGNVVFGVQLDYMEVAYIGYFVCGGIIGATMIFYAILLLLFSIIKYMKIVDVNRGKWFLLVYAYMMFLSLFEGYIFSPTYVTATIFLILVICFVDSSYINTKRISRTTI